MLKDKIMPKTIKFNELLESEKDKKNYFNQMISVNAITRKNAVKTILSALLALGIIAITTLSYFSESIYFKNIVVSLTIMGLVLIIKTIGNKKTSIKRS